MATIQERNSSFRILFVYQARRKSVTLGKVARNEADAKAGNIDLVLLRLKQGLLTLPEGMSIEEFVLADGRPPARPDERVCTPENANEPDPVVFGTFREKYLEARSGGSMEANSLATARIHLGHFERTIGAAFDLRALTLADLQRHLNRRRKDGDPRAKQERARSISAATLRLEVSTLRSAWNWAVVNKLVQGPFPTKGLQFPKADEQPPFMTWEEVERRVKAGGDAKELWDCLYLKKEELAALVAYMKVNATAPWMYPMVATAAYTGARRSELLRMEVADVDFVASTVLVREKKRSRQQRTTRRVSLTPVLSAILKEWLMVHPGGKYLFCQAGVIRGSKKRSKTTGHKNEKGRPSSRKERMETVRAREEQAIAAVTRDEAHDHFRRSLAGSMWEVLKGFHCLRHSFISCLAAAGADQRVIDDWTGHSTEEQRRRYRHLIPDLKQQVMRGVFG